MNKACIGTRSHRGVGDRPRNSTLLLAALMFAGSMATINPIKPRAAQ